MKRVAVALLLLVASPCAFADLACLAGKASARAFTEQRSVHRGQLDGLVIGADKASVLALLESRGVSVVEVVVVPEFWATKSCPSELKKLGNDGWVELRGPNSSSLGRIQLRDGQVSRVPSEAVPFPGLAVGMSRDQLVKAIAQALAGDRILAANSTPACGSPKACHFALRELDAGGTAESEDAWRFLGSDREHKYTLHFSNGLLVEASSARWRGPAL